ncbi:hypothetical protein [Mesorhizobium sp. M0618]|uniref:hypothetical protein n=1 Tax=unclassified Mesorhizobium TaxID=325217 RepID=UPI00333D05F8
MARPATFLLETGAFPRRCLLAVTSLQMPREGASQKLAAAVLLDSAAKNRQQNQVGRATTPLSWPWTKADLAKIHISSLVLRGID